MNKKELYKDFFRQISFCEKGEKIYHKIYEKYKGKKILVFPHKSLGDIFILGLFKKSEVVDFQEEHVLVVPGGACKKVANNEGIKNVEVITELEMQQMIKYIMYIGEDVLGCKILHFLYYHTSLFYSIINYKRYNFLECYSKFVFMHQLQVNKCEVNKKVGEEILKKYPINKNKTIVIAPYAKSVYNFSMEFWNNMVMLLRNQGFKKIYTNCAGNEQPIVGTEKIDISINDMSSYLDEAGIFIGLRSGLCDLISKSKCKKIILYPTKSFIEDSINYYSIKLFPFVDNIREYEIENECVPYDDILNYIGEQNYENKTLC